MIRCYFFFLFTTKWRRWLLLLPSFALVVFSGLMTSTPATAQGATDQWRGWYGGVTAGFARTHVDIAIPPDTSAMTYRGFTGGIVGGHNFYVTDRYLVGLEADLTFNDVMGGIAFARHKASLIARFGGFRSPSLLLYGVAGIAGGQYKARVTTTVEFDDVENELEFDIITNTELDKRLWGLTVGAGFEREVKLRGRALRWGLDYRFTNFREWNFTVDGQAFKIDPDVHELRFRLVVPFHQASALAMK